MWLFLFQLFRYSALPSASLAHLGRAA